MPAGDIPVSLWLGSGFLQRGEEEEEEEEGTESRREGARSLEGGTGSESRGQSGRTSWRQQHK